jgi:hypothetical protein
VPAAVECGDAELPKELEPARALYLRLVRDAEAMSVDDLRASLAQDDADHMIAQSGETFAALRANTTRRGASAAYALWQLAWILQGAKAVPGGVR